MFMFYQRKELQCSSETNKNSLYTVYGIRSYRNQTDNQCENTILLQFTFSSIKSHVELMFS